MQKCVVESAEKEGAMPFLRAADESGRVQFVVVVSKDDVEKSTGALNVLRAGAAPQVSDVMGAKNVLVPDMLGILRDIYARRDVSGVGGASGSHSLSASSSSHTVL